ncbi:MAG: hypothetical protein ACYC8T_30170 [Myxococcaceae bacterium]
MELVVPLVMLLAAAPGVPAYPSLAIDGGFAVDAGDRGLVIDKSSSDAGSDDVTVSPRVVVRIEGTKVLPPEVYFEVIHLPNAARPNLATAREVQRQVLDYLLRTGFELATVVARVTDTGIGLEIDEGQVERVLFLGQLSFQQVRFKLALLVPNDVFNRPLLDRQVRELSESMHMPGVRWELVRTSEVAHVGPQVTQLPPQLDFVMQGEQLIHARRPYELHIIFPEATGTGLGIDLRSGYLNGLESGVNFLKRDLLLDGDSVYAATGGGAGARTRLDTEKLYAHFSRAVLELRYDSFPLAGRVRPNLWAQGEWLARQRPDLQLENYNSLTAAAALQVELQFHKGLHFLMGSGFEWRRLFGFEGTSASPLPADVVPARRGRPFARATHESVVDPQVVRWERRHTLESEFRLYFPLPNEPLFAWADLRYQYVHSFGWHALWVKSRGYATWGDVTFHDEVSVGEFARGLFGGQFVPAALNLQLEYRFSVTRDELKVSLFHDLVLFAVRPVRGEGTLLAQLANGFGPGVHFLAHDMFQLDMYLAFGSRRKGVFAAAFTMQLQKVF